jgi:hypothetical protein
MFRRSALALSLLLSVTACQTTTRSVVDADPTSREPLLSAMKSLEGRWEGEPHEGMQAIHEIAISSNGSAVREVMFPGTQHEMTNMYTLDGNSLVMTHYCAEGNQPRMRASGVDGDRIAFMSDGVSDLKSEDEVYMGEMTLVMIDDDTMEQHWRAFRGDEVDHEAVFELHRVR